MIQHVQFPEWLDALSAASLTAGAVCALIIAFDIVRKPQKMWIMNLVWPLTALFGSVLWLWGYLRWGRAGAQPPDGKADFRVQVAKGASHCGAGCTLGDIIAEWLAFYAPGVALWFGWHRLFAEKIFAVWVLDFLLAFVIGIGFQYFTIQPMRNLSIAGGIVQALKADIASITAWQIGMYGVMAVIQFAWFGSAYGGTAPVNSLEFWFAMQIAMLGGFCTSYPANWLLIRRGVKEAM